MIELAVEWCSIAVGFILGVSATVVAYVLYDDACNAIERRIQMEVERRIKEKEEKE